MTDLTANGITTNLADIGIPLFAQNTSATGGYLYPMSSTEKDDTEFVQFLQEVIVGLTGLDGAMVRPRWQPIPPQWPELTTDWISIGILSETDLNLRGDGLRHDPTGEGSDVFTRTHRYRVLISCYGPNGWHYSGIIHDGIDIEQNLYALKNAGIGIVAITPRRNIPELINQRWLQRIDMEMVINQTYQRVYPVLNLRSAVGTIQANRLGNSVITTEFDTDDYYSGA